MPRDPRTLVLLATLLVGACKDPPADPPEDPPSAPPSAPPAAEPSPVDQDIARKRSCVERGEAATQPRFHTLVRSLCAEWVNQDIPGMAAAVVEDGALVFHLELGVRCRGMDAPVDASTGFRVGSIGKVMTAALVLDTIGRSRLDEPVSTWLPEQRWPEGMTTPTLAQLLQHRSGLGEIEPAQVIAFEGDWREALPRSPAGGPPDRWRYSNAGYVVVGAVLEAASERSYEQLVRDRSRAQGLLSLTSDGELAHAQGAACVHVREQGQLRALTVAEDLDFMPGDPSWLRPTGGLIGSAEDLARFGLGLPDRMFELGPESEPGERYGLGLRSFDLRSGERAYGHGGATGTADAELLISGDRRMAIALMANADIEWASVLVAAKSALETQQ